MIRPVLRADDPALTAYVLGELSDAERAEVESAAEADPAVRAALDEAAAAAGVLAIALRSRPRFDAARRDSRPRGDRRPGPIAHRAPAAMGPLRRDGRRRDGGRVRVDAAV
jgi:anti-sigma factor RsiW